jgi:hypothetical protein
MTDPNELLREMRNAVACSAALNWAFVERVWPLLDAACKAGNLPDEWKVAFVVNTVDVIEAKDQRIAELEKRPDYLRIGKLELEVERLRAVVDAIRDIINEGDSSLGMLRAIVKALDTKEAKP